MSVLSQVLLICGMPASGKTTFGNWLRDTHGFLHLNLELKDSLVANGLPSFWPEQRLWSMDPQQVQRFIGYLHTQDRDTVMTWGFHVDCLGLIQEMASVGVTAWWFEVDRLAAREKFASRGTVIRSGVLQPGTPDPVRFDQQMGVLTSRWAEIAMSFGERIIRTLGPDGAYLPPETILGHMAGA
jgi:hypothetical protein